MHTVRTDGAKNIFGNHRVSSMMTELILAALMELGAERNEEERDSSRCALAERGREGGKERGSTYGHKAEH